MVTRVKGGDKLAAALKKIAKGLKRPGSLQVGFMEDAKYPDGTSVAMVAAIQNFGAPRAGIPPRPFFSNMVQEKSPGWPKAIVDNLKESNYDTGMALDRVGQGIVAQLQQSIIDTYDPPLSPVTVMLRGMKANDPGLVVTGKTVAEARQRVKEGKTNYGAPTKPLVDTAHMLRSVTHRVKLK